MATETRSVLIVGGGPSGLSAAYELTRHGAKAAVYERLDGLGGLARTMELGGNRYDVGPHRFFTLNEEVNQLFLDLLGADALRVPRLTRIYYRNHFFNYPLTPFNALFGVGVGRSLLILASYLAARARRLVRPGRLESFEDWVVDRFGYRLYETFFKTYTEKVWGIPCDRIGADWASQRIKGLNLSTAVLNALFKPKRIVKTLVSEFLYPRHGAGQLYQELASRVRAAAGTIRSGAEVVRLNHRNWRVESADVRVDGRTERVSAGHYLGSAPLSDMIGMMDPAPPEVVLDACRGLRYRHHIGVKLEIEGRVFPDNWIYVHSPQVQVARISNYANFSGSMPGRAGVNPVTAEYFAFAEDALWRAGDAVLIALAIGELEELGLVKPEQVRQGFVVRSEKAYPVIEKGHEAHLETIREWLDRFENFMPIGRSGMFKYNNQDHAILTGLLAARTILGHGDFDPWAVNIDASYHEGGHIRNCR